MKKDWASAILNLNQMRQLTRRTKKRVCFTRYFYSTPDFISIILSFVFIFFQLQIVVYLGAFAAIPRILRRAFSGGSLGELLQWSDIITSFYLLGHDVTVVKYHDELLR